MFVLIQAYRARIRVIAFTATHSTIKKNLASRNTTEGSAISPRDSTPASLIADAQSLSTVDELRAVHGAAVRLHHVMAPQELAAETIRVLEDTLGYDHAAVLLTDEHSDRLIPFALSDQGRGRAFAHEDMHYVATHDIRLDKGITGWVARHGVSVRSGNVNEDPRYYGLRSSIFSELCVPIIVDGRVFGVVNVETRERDAYTRSDQQVLEIIAAQIGMAIEKSRLHEELINAQRLEAVGRLTAGIAHDFNNILTVINGQAELLLSDDQLDDHVREGLTQIQRAGESAAQTTRQLLAFSRKAHVTPQVFEPAAVVENLRLMLTRMLGDNIDLEITAAEPVHPVEMDPAQFGQVLINLAVNAREAMPDGGRFVIHMAPERVNGASGAGLDRILPGEYVLLTIRDTGMGIEPEVLPRLFEPFFTTKASGTGLGLATVHGILRQSGGYIRAYSQPGRGACFRVYLPVAQRELTPELREIETLPLPRLDGAVLLAEDDPDVRHLVASLIRSFGYDVLEARSGVEALGLADSVSTSIPLLISDVVMPGMSGVELAKRIRARRPGIHVLLMSGYPKDRPDDRADDLNGERLLLKPFTRASLKRALTDLLGDASGFADARAD